MSENQLAVEKGTYEQFQQKIIAELKQQLLDVESIDIHNVLKNNDSKWCGITIKTQKSNVSPIIYLDDFYDEYKSGNTIENIVQEIINMYKETPDRNKVIKNLKFGYDEIKGKIRCRIINTRMNKELLEIVPHKNIMDVSFVYYIEFDKDENHSISSIVKSSLLEKWKINKEELHKIAYENTVNAYPAYMYRISDAINGVNIKEKDMLRNGMVEKDMMYVLTNESNMHGSVCIFYPDMAEHIGEVLQDDYCVIPSSIHEVLILPKSIGYNEDEVHNMISLANAEELRNEEILNNHGYFYNRKRKMFRW